MQCHYSCCECDDAPNLLLSRIRPSLFTYLTQAKDRAHIIIDYYYYYKNSKYRHLAIQDRRYGSEGGKSAPCSVLFMLYTRDPTPIVHQPLLTHRPSLSIAEFFFQVPWASKPIWMHAFSGVFFESSLIPHHPPSTIHQFHPSIPEDGLVY